MLSSSSVSNVDNNGEGDSLPEDSITKKVRFKESNVNLEVVMVVEDSNTKKNNTNNGHFLVDNFSFTGQDVKKLVVDGVPSIDFSERVYQLLEKEMSTSVVLKMLGRTLGITTLHNRLYGAWKPSKLFQLMDIENGKVTKLDFNTDSKARGRYARMEIYVNLGRPLVSKILINASLKELKMKEKGEMLEQNLSTSVVVGDGDYGPWMLVERRSRRDTLDDIKKGNNSKGEKIMGSRFQLLAAANQQAPLDIQQASSSFNFGQELETQVSKEARTDLSKLSSVMHNGFVAYYVKMNTPISIQKQVEHVVHFNPIFKESSFVNVAVKEGVLEAKNHSAVVLKKSSILELVSEKIGGSVCPTEIKLPRVVLKGQNTNAKVTSSKEGWKLNKTLKGLSNRFKNSENTRVYFVDSIKRAAELIASEIDENSAKDLSQ
ncbi:hypothetical protein Goklo_006228 [Gossypium klotzschianum]|uniref:Uncharacterized protein n=1 Tax=Gossypium klotzschianum TaxID=34286 RepID=A0A7J8VGU7_9ROSI|nr:hypothetical protein [Gossypium klotzschianum]